MFHAIVCSGCKVEFRCAKNGVEVVDYASFGPYKIWEADEWECPSCHVRIITGFSDECTHVNQMSLVGLAGVIQRSADAGRLRPNYEYPFKSEVSDA